RTARACILTTGAWSRALEDRTAPGAARRSPQALPGHHPCARAARLAAEGRPRRGSDADDRLLRHAAWRRLAAAVRRSSGRMSVRDVGPRRSAGCEAGRIQEIDARADEAQHDQESAIQDHRHDGDVRWHAVLREQIDERALVYAEPVERYRQHGNERR